MNTKVKGMVMSAVIIASVLVAFSAPAAANWTYDGYEVKTMTDGTVQGDVFVGYGDNKGAKNGRLDVPYPGPYRTNYSVPNGNSVKWARLVVGVWGGNELNCGWLNTTLHNGTQLNYLGNVTIGNSSTPDIADDDSNNTIYSENTNVYGTGHGCWMVAYNVTNNVSLNAWNNVTATTYTAPGDDLDGRIYGIVLVVVYENTSLVKVKYWVNEGNVNLHYNMSSAPYNYVLDNTTTWFNGTAYNSTDAKLWVEYFAGSRHEPDYLYFNPPDEVRTNKCWDVSAYKKWQLDGNTSANGSDVAYGSSTSAGWDPWGSAYGWDLHNFTKTNTTNLSDIINKTANNSAFFWRGHDDNCDCWISAEFNGGTGDEGEDYLHPVLAVLILKNVTHVYDFSDNFSGTAGTDAWAFKYQICNDPGAGDPGIVFSATEYAAIKADDGVFACNTTTDDGCYAAHRFNFSIDETAPEKINVTWNGIGDHDSAIDGAKLYIYNFSSAAYEQLDSDPTGPPDEITLTGEKTSSISSYINANNVTILVNQTSAHSGLYVSYIWTDYIKLVVTPDP